MFLVLMGAFLLHGNGLAGHVPVMGARLCSIRLTGIFSQADTRRVPLVRNLSCRRLWSSCSVASRSGLACCRIN